MFQQAASPLDLVPPGVMNIIIISRQLPYAASNGLDRNYARLSALRLQNAEPN